MGPSDSWLSSGPEASRDNGTPVLWPSSPARSDCLLYSTPAWAGQHRLGVWGGGSTSCPSRLSSGTAQGCSSNMSHMEQRPPQSLAFPDTFLPFQASLGSPSLPCWQQVNPSSQEAHLSSQDSPFSIPTARPGTYEVIMC